MIDRQILKWDWPLQIFHGLLILTLSCCYISALIEPLWLVWHIQFGLSLLSLLIFRLLWGFYGSQSSRFISFLPTLSSLLDYCRGTWSGSSHNPLAALWILTSLTVLTMQCLFGLFSANDELDIYAPLYFLSSDDWIKRADSWHIRMAYLFPLLILMHLVAVIYYSRVKSVVIVRPMFVLFSQLRRKSNLSHPRFNTRHLLYALGAAVFVYLALSTDYIATLVADVQESDRSVIVNW